MANNGIRGIRQSIPSGFYIGRSSPGSTKGAPQLLPIPPVNQQAIIAGSGGKATQGGGSTTGGGVATAATTVASGTGITVSGAYPAYTVSLTVPVSVADGGTGTATAGQLPATATNDNAAAGKVGEYASSILLVGSNVVLVSGTAANITSLNLTAGDWDVWGEVWLNMASTTALTFAVADVSLTTPSAANVPGDGTIRTVMGSVPAGSGSAAQTVIAIPPCRASLAGTTTYYLNTNASFTVSTCGAYGILRARRVR